MADKIVVPGLEYTYISPYGTAKIVAKCLVWMGWAVVGGIAFVMAGMLLLTPSSLLYLPYGVYALLGGLIFLGSAYTAHAILSMADTQAELLALMQAHVGARNTAQWD